MCLGNCYALYQYSVNFVVTRQGPNRDKEGDSRKQLQTGIFGAVSDRWPYACLSLPHDRIILDRRNLLPRSRVLLHRQYPLHRHRQPRRMLPQSSQTVRKTSRMVSGNFCTHNLR